MQWILVMLVACDAGVPVEKPVTRPDGDYAVIRLDGWNDEPTNLGGMHYTFSSGGQRFHGGRHGFRGIEHVLPVSIMGDGEQLRGAFYVAKLERRRVTDRWLPPEITFDGEVIQFSRPMTEADATAALANRLPAMYDFRHDTPLREEIGDLMRQPVVEHVVVQLVAAQTECSNAGGTHYSFSAGGTQFHGGGHGFWSFNDTLTVGRFYVAEIQRMAVPALANPGWCLDVMPTFAGEVLAVVAATDEADAKAKLDAIPKAGFLPTVQLR